MTDIPADPSGPQLDPDLPEQGIDTGAAELPDVTDLPGAAEDPDALDGPEVPDPNADLMRADTDSLPDTQVPGAGPDGGSSASS